MKGHPILTIIVVFVLALTPACAPRAVDSQTAATDPAGTEVPAETGQPAETTQPAVTEPAVTEPERLKEPLPDLALEAPSGSAAEAAARLAEGLASAQTALEAYPLVVELLAWSGIPVYDSETAELLMPVVEPAAELTFFDFEAYGFALDIINGSGLLLSETAEALAEAETALNDIPISTEYLEELLAQWVLIAQELDPESWEAFVPLYLAESALRKPVAIDLTYPGYGEDLHYSHVEWLLFFAAQVRTGAEVPASLAAADSGRGLAAPARLDMCTLYQKALKKLGDYLAGEINSATGEALGKATEKAGEVLGGAAGTAARWTGKGLGWMMALLSVVANSTAWRIEVTGSPDPSHYRHDESNEVTAQFITRVTLEEKWPEWFGSCMKGLGMDVPDQDSIKSAKVRWRGVRGFPKHATISADGMNGQLESRFNDAGEAKMKIILSREKNWDWTTAPQKEDTLKVKVELLFDAKFPGPATWVTAAIGGPAGAVGASASILAQWYQRWFPESAYGTMVVEYHKIVPMTFERVTYSNGVEMVFRGYNCEGLYGDWVMEASINGQMEGIQVVGSGSYTGHIPREGETGAFTGSMDIGFSVQGISLPIGGGITTSSDGEMSIKGTRQAPVLQMKALYSSGMGTADTPTVGLRLPFEGPGGSPVGFLLKESPDDPRCKGK